MADPKQISQALRLLMVTALLFLAGRFLGGALFDNSWSFTHFSHLPFWYPILWLALSVGIAYLFISRGEVIGRLCSSRRRVVIASVVLFVLMIIFRHDSLQSSR